MDIRAVTSHAFVQDNACKLLENVVKNVYNVSGKEPALLNFTEPLLKHSTLVTEQCSSPYKITEEQIDFFFHGCRVCPGEKTPPCSRMHVPPGLVAGASSHPLWVPLGLLLTFISQT